jgi:predicted secreted acid phosphatase
MMMVVFYFIFDYRGNKLNVTSLEEWMRKGKATALDHSLRLFNELKSRGIQIILITARREHLRSATVDNLVNVGYYGWTKIFFRSV